MAQERQNMAETTPGGVPPPPFEGAKPVFRLGQFLRYEGEPPTQGMSVFENTLLNIRELEAAPQDPNRDTQLTEAMRLRDEMLRNVNQLGLLNNIKDRAYYLYRDSRIDVPPSDKGQRVAILLNELQKVEMESIETDNFWAMQQRRGIQKGTYEGIFDYVRRENLALIRAVIEDPKRQDIPNNGVSIVWENYQAKDEAGRLRPEATIDPATGVSEIRNFADLRATIESERRERPRYIGSRGNYLLPIEFIADGIDELPDVVDDFLNRLEEEVVSGTVEEIGRSLQERSGWGQKAMEAFMRHFGYDASHPVVLRETSKMSSVTRILTAAILAGYGKEALKNYCEQLMGWGEGFRTVDVDGKRINENYFDVLYFDDEGWMPQALQIRAHNKGERNRFGSSSSKPPTQQEMDRYLEDTRQKDIDNMAGNELHDIDYLLVNHPAFQRLRVKMNRMDSTGGLWQEYVGEARAWQKYLKKETPTDTRNPRATYKFEHPLSRILSEQELVLMYRPLQQKPGETNIQFERRKEDRKRRAGIVLRRAERLGTALQTDTRATSARLILKDVNGNPTGEVKSYMDLFQEKLMEIVRTDEQKPLYQRRFKVFHVLNKLGLVDYPTYAAYNLGADDTEREQLLKHFEAEPELKAIIDAELVGPNAKTTIVRWVEDERRVMTLLERIIRNNNKIPTTDSQGRQVFADGTKYFNSPGYDTPGGGVKHIKNTLYPYYGISRDTVEANALIPTAHYGGQDFLTEFGCDNFRTFVGWLKRGDEIELAEEGTAFKSPRDFKLWVERFESVALLQNPLWTKAQEDKEGPKGALMGPISGAFLVRAMNLNQGNYINGERDAVDAVGDPEKAIDRLSEQGYREHLKTTMGVFEPLARIMQSRAKLENVYGGAAGTAKFENTLTWYDWSDWMDYHNEEYREKFGFAIDAKLRLARYFVNTGFFEDRHIYYDDGWDEIMLGIDPDKSKGNYGRKIKDKITINGQVVEYERQGILDALPKEYWPFVPYLKESRYPEVLNLAGENPDVVKRYSKAPTSKTGRYSRFSRENNPVPRDTIRQYPREYLKGLI